MPCSPMRTPYTPDYDCHEDGAAQDEHMPYVEFLNNDPGYDSGLRQVRSLVLPGGARWFVSSVIPLF